MTVEIKKRARYFDKQRWSREMKGNGYEVYTSRAINLSVGEIVDADCTIIEQYVQEVWDEDNEIEIVHHPDSYTILQKAKIL